MTRVPGEAERGAAPGWLAEARPPVPAEFAPWLALDTGEGDGGDPPWVDAFTRAGLGALDRALARVGREGAFDLLAADGFLTWAADAMLAGGDPAARLEALAERIARRSEPPRDGAGDPAVGTG